MEADRLNAWLLRIQLGLRPLADSESYIASRPLQSRVSALAEKPTDVKAGGVWGSGGQRLRGQEPRGQSGQVRIWSS